MNNQNEVRKIGTACFVGGALFCAVALFVAPAFCWLGLLAGFASGYLSYEFREVCRAVPRAIRGAWKEMLVQTHAGFEMLHEWWKGPHPDLPFLTIFASVAVAVFCRMWQSREFIMRPNTMRGDEVFVLFVGPVFVGCFIASVMFFVSRLGEREFAATTAVDVYWQIARGLGKIAKFIPCFLFWYVWKWSAIGLWHSGRFVMLASRHFFRIIHSNKRLLCGFDSVIGGGIAYRFGASVVQSPSESLFVIACGGLLGALIGISHWKIAPYLRFDRGRIRA